MGLKGPIFFIFNRNQWWFLLQFLCIVFGFLPFIVSDESFELNHDDRIAEAKAKILKIIQKGNSLQFFFRKDLKKISFHLQFTCGICTTKKVVSFILIKAILFLHNHNCVFQEIS